MKALVSVLTCLVLLAACDSDGGGSAMPTREVLFGTWVNDDQGTTRAFEFAAAGYTLYFYPTGAAPVVAQRGDFRIEEGHLVTSVTEAPLDASLVGREFANEILGFDAAHLTLESSTTATGQRRFDKRDAL